MALFRAFSGALSHEGETKNKKQKEEEQVENKSSDNKNYWGMFVSVTLLTDLGATPFWANWRQFSESVSNLWVNQDNGLPDLLPVVLGHYLSWPSWTLLCVKSASFPQQIEQISIKS